MANLGSSDTPIKGQDFELPAGAKLAEVNGDLAIVDSNGNPLLRRDETAGEWNLEGTELANIGSVRTDELQSEIQPNGGLSPWANGKMQASKQQYFPSFERYSGNPILSTSDLSWSPSNGAELHWPSVMRTDPLDNPLGKYYLYYSPHDSDGLSLAYADSVTGPWTDYANNPIAGDRLEPGAFYHPENGEVWLYNLKSNNELHLITTPNGVDTLTLEGTVYPPEIEGHVGYPNPLYTPQGIYLSTWQKLDNDMQTPVLRWSADGKSDWSVVQTRFGADGRSQPSGDSGDFYHDGVSMVPFDPLDGYLCAWGRQNGSQWDIYHGTTTDGVHIRDYGRLLQGGGQSWENGRVAEPEFVWTDDGRLAMFYAGGSVGSQQIGVAIADFSEVKA